MKKDDLFYIFFIIILSATILLQRIAIPFGSNEVPISVFFIYFYIIYLLLTNKLLINEKKAILLIISLGSIFSTVIIFHYNFSLFSLIYLVILYIPFILTIKKGSPIKLTVYLNGFQNVISIISLLSILQFVLQKTNGFYLNLTSLIPEKFILDGYIFTYPIFGSSSLLKSNGGGLLLEPSFLSQFVALSIIVELVYFKRLIRLLALGMALILSFSGTGLIILSLFGTLAFFNLKLNKQLLILPSIVIFGLFFINSEYYQVYEIRFESESLNSNETSFNKRFVAPFQAVQDGLDTPEKFLFGLGPGAADDLSINYYANFSVIPKLLIEYGFFNTCLFLTFIIYCFFFNRIPLILTGSVFLIYIILSGSLLQPHTVFFAYGITSLLPYDTNFILKRRKQIDRKNIYAIK
jgi:hypothetical protein